MDLPALWGIVLIVLGAVGALIVARISRKPFRYRHERPERETAFLNRPVNLLALLAAIATLILGLFWRLTAGGPS